MLKKLIKYEWKAVWKVLLIINAFTVITTIIGMLLLRTLEGNISEVSRSSAILLFALYYITIIGVSLAMTIYVGIRFYHNFYTDEGYLMHTLPVTKRQLVLSKLLVHSVCEWITQLLVMISLGILLLPLMVEVLEVPGLTMSSLISEWMDLIHDASISLPAFLAVTLVSAVIGTFSGTLAIYCAIVLGQTFHRHRVMGSILCYIGIYCLIQSVTSVLMMPQMLYIQSTDFNPMSYLTNTITTISIASLFLGIVWYCITLYMMNKKLNLE